MTTSRDDQVTHAARAHSFNAVAAQYADHRPTYPPALFDAIEELAGRPLAGSRAVDVGAGTGMATARLLERGARVVAVEPGAGMAAEFRHRLPGTPVVRGDGNAPPRRPHRRPDHVRPVLALDRPRPLRPGGATGPAARRRPRAVVEHQRPRRAVDRRGDRPRRPPLRAGLLPRATGLRPSVADPSGRLDLRRHTVRWSRRVPVDTHLANIGSHSLFLVQSPHRTAAYLAEERRHVLEVFPDGMVEETYDVVLLLASAPRAA